jgi:hypothetical protein
MPGARISNPHSRSRPVLNNDFSSVIEWKTRCGMDVQTTGRTGHKNKTYISVAVLFIVIDTSIDVQKCSTIYLEIYTFITVEFDITTKNTYVCFLFT